MSKIKAFALIALLALSACKKDSNEDKNTSTEATNNLATAEDGTVALEKATAPRGENELESQEVAYEAGDTTLKGYLVYDPAVKGERPGVLVVHEWWGHNEYARSRADKLAKLGYTALAVDMYGEGKTAEHPEDAQKFMQQVMSDFDVAKGRFVAGKELLEKHETTNSGKTAAIGYCMGGAIVLNMARAGLDLDAVASFHAGSLAPATEANKETFPTNVMVFHGAADPFVPKEQVDAFKKEMEGLGAEPTFIVYEGAKHAFTNPRATELGKKFELPLAYDQEADEDSWNKAVEGLEAAFADSGSE